MNRNPHFLRHCVKTLCYSIFSLVFLTTGLVADDALFINRTLFENDDSTIAGNVVEQNGLMIGVDVDSDRSWSIGFWLRRVVQPDTVSAGYADQNATIVGNGGGNSTMFEESDLLPDSDDYSWHYVYLTHSSASSVNAYVDNVWVQSYAPGGISTAHVVLGSRGINATSSFYKAPTGENLLFDDITVWSDASQDVLDYHETIFQRGIGKANIESSSLLQQYFSCDSLASSPAVFTEDDTNYRLVSSAVLGSLDDAISYFVSDDDFVDASDKPILLVSVDIETEYGANEVSPAVDAAEFYSYALEQRFEAPAYIYMDRFGNELGSSDDNTTQFIDQAFIRARNVGYAVDGTDNQGTDRFFTISSLEDDITVIWKWEIEYAVVIEYEAGNTDISSADGNPSISGVDVASQNSIGRKWVAEDSIISAEVDSSIVIGDNRDSRFSATGYKVENFPRSDNDINNVISFDGSAGYLYDNSTNLDLTTADFTIEFLARRIPSANTDRQYLLSIGNSSSSNQQINIGFESDTDDNAFVINRNSASDEVSANSSYTDEDWHHWALLFDDSLNDMLIYRDGILIESDTNFSLNYSGGSTVTLGANYVSGALNHFCGNLDNVRVWDHIRSEAEIAESIATQSYGSATGLELELCFDTDYTVDSSSASSGLSVAASDATTFTYYDIDEMFAASIDYDDMGSTLFPTYRETTFESVGLRVSSEEYTIRGWMRITYTWDKEFRIDISSSDDQGDLNIFESLPYITGDYTLDGTGEVWVPENSAITVGTRYRNDSRHYTLSQTVGGTGLFANYNFDDLTDGTDPDSNVSREFTIGSVTEAGQLTWLYSKTIFYAQITIGDGLDVASTTSLNLQLTPDLAVDGELLITGETPNPVFASTDTDVIRNGGTVGNLTQQVQWDEVGQQMLPLMPGEYRYEWKDANDPSESYYIQIATHLPQETALTSWELENDAGVRLLDGDNDYVTEYTFGSISDNFPASPLAHYRHLYSADSNQQPPLELDPNESDNWFYHGVSFSSGAILYQNQNPSFTAASDAYTVLLFSYRPDTTEVANGDEAQEAFAVRIVDSTSLEDAKQTDTALSSGNRQALTLNESDAYYLQFSDQSADFALGNDVDRTLATWLKLDDSLVTDTSRDRLFFETKHSDSALLIRAGFRSADDVDAPSALFFEYEGDGSASYAFTEFTPGETWHHYAFVIDSQSGTLNVYVDGRLLQSIENALSFTANASNIAYVFGNSTQSTSEWLNGTIDNLSFISSALTVSDVRSLMSGNLSSTPDVAFSFDDGLSGDDVLNSGSHATTGDLIDSGSLTSVNATLALIDQSTDFFPEVATRLASKLDTADFETGYLLNEVSNYNPNIYQRDANVGTWGNIYPVNWSGLYDTDNTELSVAYYENPFYHQNHEVSNLHPNVAWPYIVVGYESVSFPTYGVHKDKRIYIASRLGSEGVDANSSNQLVFDPAVYSQLDIYNQPAPDVTGYNPNEEHALLAPSIKDQLTGDNTYNLSQNAAFALQKHLNVWGETDSVTGDDNDASDYTSEPWVLVQYQISETEEWQMAAYYVELTRDASGAVFPVLDADTNLATDALGSPVTQPTDPSYDFEYATYAGDIHIPPYPLNRVIGSVIVDEDWGGNIGTQRALWHDINGNAWTVSGDGQYFYKYWYPFRSDFWYESSSYDGDNDISVGTPIAWLPADESTFFEDGNTSTDEDTEPAQPQIIVWNSYWGDSYPVLKRGESLTYTGGEYYNENSGAEGLPGMVGFAASQIIYDSANTLMHYNEYTAELYSARVVRALDRIEIDFSQSELPDELTPAYTDNLMVDAERYYFRQLTGSLQKRLYFDSLRSKLVFRGRINDLESGDPDLTSTPVSLYVLEPNVMTQSEYESIITMLTDLGIDTGSTTFDDAVESIYLNSQNPHELTFADADNEVNSTEQKFYAGLEALDTEDDIQPGFYTLDTDTDVLTEQSDEDTRDLINALILLFSGKAGEVTLDDLSANAYQPISSLGTGSVLIPNADLLTASPTGADYITLVENNHEDASGAISLHIVQIGEERYRGSIKVIEAADVFSEKINVKHTGDFGGNSEEIYYQWWVRNVDTLDSVGLPVEAVSSEDYDVDWQLYQEGLGLTTIEFAGRPDITLADKLFYVRYGHGDEFDDVTGESNVVSNDASIAYVSEDSWRLVDINDETDDYDRSGSDDLTDSTGESVPYQWAGASNSPQYQADGSYDYVPQLIMGWVKRVLDRVNPYEARYSDFYNNESPATYSSQIQIAGGPYSGNVALNSDKDVIENVGLIELYETVLDRAKSLSLEIIGAADSGTNQAVLLAATRLAFLYELLAREAYTDVQNPTIPVTDDNELSSVSSYVHAFYNQQASLLDEELALLRGTDFVVAYPAYNRMFWNYVKGEGEAAYNATYDIYDVTDDGFINEYDAAALYPQGHGDAWGHFLSANSMHYELLQHNAFDWEAKSELYSLLDNVIQADYLDEGSFARIAAAKSRTGLETLRATYRSAYTEDPDGQWQGYTDSDTARAWGVSEWAKRSGQAALFDWAIGNAILPAELDDDAENLDRLDRRSAELELREIAASLNSTQVEMDGINAGFNPIGMDADAITFDIDPQLLDGASGLDRETHFEQVYAKAIAAAENARIALDFATQSDQQIRKIAADSQSLSREALFQDIDYRNQLIAIFGSPYDGTIGTGEIFAEGYEGPDTLLYLYIDQIDIDDYIPSETDRYTTLRDDTISTLSTSYESIDFDSGFLYDGPNDSISDIFDEFYLTADFEEATIETTVPIGTISDYAFQADDDWGARVSTGKIQVSLQNYIYAELELEKSIAQYNALVDQMLIQSQRLESILDAQKNIQDTRGTASDLAIVASTVKITGQILGSMFDFGSELSRLTSSAIKEGFPTVVGMSNDLTSVARGAIMFGNAAVVTNFRWGSTILGTIPEAVGSASLSVIYEQLQRQEDLNDEMIQIRNTAAEVAMILTQEEALRIEIGQNVARMQSLEREIFTAVSEGFRLMDEREAFNTTIAAAVQRNRYGDMIYRLTRNDALRKYQDAYNHALRYAWLAAKAYDYETSLSAGQSAAATSIIEDLTKVRTLGLWDSGEPQIGQGGLAEALAQLKSNFDTLEGQLGINNPQFETGKLSLRDQFARIRDDNTNSNKNWQKRLQAWRVEDLWDIDEYRALCRPIADPEDGAQPGIIIEFSSEINEGLNFFGQPLGAGDQAYSLSNYATKIRSVGVWLEGYNDAALATAPRAYLIPVGSDVLRLADSDLPETRSWNVVEQRIPAPYTINASDLTDTSYIPSIDSLNGSFAERKRFSDFRAYHDSGGESIDSGEMVSDSRLVGRSVWNTRWMLIIPGAYMHADADYGLDEFVDNVSDIKLVFETYSHSGQ